MMKVLRFNFILVVCMLLFNKVSAQAPVVTSLSPNDNATSVSTQVNLRIAFDRAIVKNSGTISIRQTSDNSIVESFDVISSRIAISSDSVVTIDPVYNFSLASGYYVEITSGAFISSTGEAFLGISGAVTWNFTTGCAQAPIGLGEGFISNTSAILIWEPVEGVSEYQVWVNGIGLNYVSGGLTELYIQGLAPGTQYTWSVKAICKGSSGTFYSNSTSRAFLTTGTNPCAAAPSLLAPNITNNSIKLNWSAKVGVSDYIVWISGLGTFYTNGLNSFTANNLPSGTTFSWSVKSVCSGNANTVFSASSSGQSTTTGTNPCASAPSLLATDITDNSITINWSPKIGVSDYQVWISGKGTFYTSGAASFTATDLPSGTTFSWSVKSVCFGNANTIYSVASSGQSTTTGTDPCATPPNILSTSDITESSVVLNWTPIEGVNDYQVWVSGIGTISSTNGSSNYALFGLEAGTTYSWSVKSKCSESGGTSYSNGSSDQFTTAGENPCAVAPGELVVTNITSTSATLTWSNTGANDYLLWIGGEDIVSSTSGLNTFTVNGLQPNTSYFWRVKSRCTLSGKTTFGPLSVSSTFITDAEVPFDSQATTEIDVEKSLNTEVKLLTEVSNVSEVSLNIYPNPSMDVVNVAVSGSDLIASIIVRNLHGNVIEQINEIKKPSKSLNLQRFGSGVYIIHIVTETNREFIRKVIIK